MNTTSLEVVGSRTDSAATLSAAVMRLMADYVVKALEEWNALVAEGDTVESLEVEAAEMSSLVNRVQRVVRLIQQWKAPSRHARGASLKADSSMMTHLAVCGIESCFYQVSGVAVPSLESSLFSTGPFAPSLRRAANSVSLEEAALEVFGMNTKVVYRRKRPAQEKGNDSHQTKVGGAAPKRHRPEGSPSVLTQTVYERLSQEQRKERHALYSSRSALLPRVDAVVAPYVSPAVRAYITLQVASQCAMLEQAWHVGTKIQLLREVHKLKDAVREYRDQLHSVNLSQANQVEPLHQRPQLHPTSDTTETGSLHRYFRFDSFNKGVVRICVQDALFVDVTYDIAQKHWVVLQLHWNLWVLPAAYLEGTPFVSPHAERLTFPHDALTRVIPSHAEAMHRYLHKSFEEGGFDAGCTAANRLLCSTVMDLIISQLTELRDVFFTGPLASLYSMDVRPGTFVACTVKRPLIASDHEATQAVESTCSTRDILHIKCHMVGGTVILERWWNTSVGDMMRICVISATDVPDAVSRVIINVENLIWTALVSPRCALQ